MTKDYSLESPLASLHLPHCCDDGYLSVGGSARKLTDPLAEGVGIKPSNTRVELEKRLDISVVTYYKKKVLRKERLKERR